jgi:hypothetical protein
LVNGGSITSWYFTSRKNGAILKKKFDKLTVIDCFKTLYRESPIALEEDFNDKKINSYLKKDESDEEEENAKMNYPLFSEREGNLISMKKIIKQMQIKINN